MTQKVIFTRGIPGSGKSSWAKKYCLEHKNFVRVNRDELRLMRGKLWIPEQENMITNNEISCMSNALSAGYNVIIDAMNLNQKSVDKLIFAAKGATANGVEFEFKDFTQVPLKECIRRDANRPEEIRCGEKIIKEKYYKYIAKKIETNKDQRLPHVIICDLDGTLAHYNGRSPYDYSNVYLDLVDETVLSILMKYKYGECEQIEILFVSGRDDICRDDTIKWLKEKCGFPEVTLFMRKTGDNRPDFIIKKEIFLEHIRENYYIDFVLDDREQVVDMWRNELGLKVLQVAEGDF